MVFGALAGFTFLFFASEDKVLSTAVLGVMYAVLFSGVVMGWLSVGRLVSWQLIP